MLTYPNIKPYIIKIGPLEVRWYGLMYIIGFISSYLLFKYQVKKRGLDIPQEHIEGLYFYMVLGIILGSRIGYAVFYNFGAFMDNPVEIFYIWRGGMSFHGGLFGCALGGYLYTIIKKQDYRLFTDLVVVSVPIGLFAGRIGNFINGELIGRPSTLPWAMDFGDGIGRHPSQIYEATLEGALLFVIMWILKDKVKSRGAMLPIFLMLYGIIRFAVEFTREPDIQLGFVLGPLSMGQVLSAAMFAVGAVLFYTWPIKIEK